MCSARNFVKFCDFPHFKASWHNFDVFSKEILLAGKVVSVLQEKKAIKTNKKTSTCLILPSWQLQSR